MWIGVVLGIPEPYSSELTEARRAAGDPLGRHIPPHVTLLPPIRVEDSALPRVREHLIRAAAAHEPFVLELSGTKTFRPISPVVFVALEQGWDDCLSLQREVNSGVLETELQFSYHPHVTIAQSVPGPQLDRAQESMSDFAARFTISSIDLYEWEDGSGWERAESFDLASRARSVHPSTLHP